MRARTRGPRAERRRARPAVRRRGGRSCLGTRVRGARPVRRGPSSRRARPCAPREPATRTRRTGGSRLP
ncbi:MAG: hypothetical protein E4H11_09485 [Myxococcales bacterium]|nr:MAG: hypothetical protein E4H11_09485 [Myxococcales bacterium]